MHKKINETQISLPDRLHVSNKTYQKLKDNQEFSIHNNLAFDTSGNS